MVKFVLITLAISMATMVLLHQKNLAIRFLLLGGKNPETLYVRKAIDDPKCDYYGPISKFWVFYDVLFVSIICEILALVVLNLNPELGEFDRNISGIVSGFNILVNFVLWAYYGSAEKEGGFQRYYMRGNDTVERLRRWKRFVLFIVRIGWASIVYLITLLFTPYRNAMYLYIALGIFFLAIVVYTIFSIKIYKVSGVIDI